ncbi:MAG: PTS sugar transporter subunit IIB [Longicatena sp.]
MITHTRIDYRLIHGQVITKWVKCANANKIVIIDDVLATDEFLGMVYKMAAPTGISVNIMSVDKAITLWEQGKFDAGNTLLLFKTVDCALDTVKKGMNIKELQVGGLENKPNRKVVFNQITLDKIDGDKLTEIENMGIRVYFQTIPEEEPGSLQKMIKKL